MDYSFVRNILQKLRVVYEVNRIIHHHLYQERPPRLSRPKGGSTNTRVTRSFLVLYRTAGIRLNGGKT